MLDGRKGAEVILNNIGDEPATYRISVEFRRMTETGDLVDVTTPSATDKKAEDMIVYAPRKVTWRRTSRKRSASRLARRGHPRWRISCPPAVPRNSAGDTGGPDPDEQAKSVQFKLTPIYGVTIPVIVRLGNLQATAGIADVHLESKDGAPPVGLDLTRTGSRSTYGEVRVLKAGVKDPIADPEGCCGLHRGRQAPRQRADRGYLQGRRRRPGDRRIYRDLR